MSYLEDSSPGLFSRIFCGTYMLEKLKKYHFETDFYFLMSFVIVIVMVSMLYYSYISNIETGLANQFKNVFVIFL